MIKQVTMSAIMVLASTTAMAYSTVDMDDSFSQGPVVTIPNFGQDAGFVPEAPTEQPNGGGMDRPEMPSTGELPSITHPNDTDNGFNNPSEVDPSFGQGSVLPKPVPQPEVDGDFTNPTEGLLEADQNQAISGNTAGIQQNASAISGLNNRVDGLASRMDSMAKDIDTLNDGVAGAMAMSALPQAFMPESTVVGFGAAHFNGSNSIAVGASHKFDDHWTANLKASFGGESGVAVGVGYEF